MKDSMNIQRQQKTSYENSSAISDNLMESITNFLEKKLKLKVNKEKSAVDRPTRRRFLGFSIVNNDIFIALFIF